MLDEHDSRLKFEEALDMFNIREFDPRNLDTRAIKGKAATLDMNNRISLDNAIPKLCSKILNFLKSDELEELDCSSQYHSSEKVDGIVFDFGISHEKIMIFDFRFCDREDFLGVSRGFYISGNLVDIASTGGLSMIIDYIETKPGRFLSICWGNDVNFTKIFYIEDFNDSGPAGIDYLAAGDGTDLIFENLQNYRGANSDIDICVMDRLDTGFITPGLVGPFPTVPVLFTSIIPVGGSLTAADANDDNSFSEDLLIADFNQNWLKADGTALDQLVYFNGLQDGVSTPTVAGSTEAVNVFEGRGGDDWLEGGEGNDIFIVALSDDAVSNNELVVEFENSDSNGLDNGRELSDHPATYGNSGFLIESETFVIDLSDMPITEDDEFMVRSYQDRIDDESVPDLQSSLGLEAYAEDLVVGVQNGTTKLVEDQEYRIYIENLKENDTVSIKFNGKVYSKTVPFEGVSNADDVPGPDEPGENLSQTTEDFLQDFIEEINAEIESDPHGRDGHIFLEFVNTEDEGGAPEQGGENSGEIIVRERENSKDDAEHVFIQFPMVTVTNESGGEAPGYIVKETSDTSVVLYDYDFRADDTDGLNRDIFVNSQRDGMQFNDQIPLERFVTFEDTTGRNRSILQDAATFGGVMFGLEAAVDGTDIGGNDDDDISIGDDTILKLDQCRFNIFKKAPYLGDDTYDLGAGSDVAFINLEDGTGADSYQGGNDNDIFNITDQGLSSEPDCDTIDGDAGMADVLNLCAVSNASEQNSVATGELVTDGGESILIDLTVASNITGFLDPTMRTKISVIVDVQIGALLETMAYMAVANAIEQALTKLTPRQHRASNMDILGDCGTAPAECHEMACRLPKTPIYSRVSGSVGVPIQMGHNVTYTEKSIDSILS
ncbi:MAG: hypothetical protein AAFR79_00775 [Pseudomonadota bacterium]